MNLVRKNNKYIVPRGRSKMSHGGPPPHPEDEVFIDPENFLLNTVGLPAQGWSDFWKIPDDAFWEVGKERNRAGDSSVLRDKGLHSDYADFYGFDSYTEGGMAGEEMLRWNEFLESIDTDFDLNDPKQKREFMRNYEAFYSNVKKDKSIRRSESNKYYREMKRFYNDPLSALIRNADGSWAVPHEVLNKKWPMAANLGIDLTELFNRVATQKYWKENDKLADSVINKMDAYIGGLSEKERMNLQLTGAPDSFFLDTIGFSPEEYNVYKAFNNDVASFMSSNMGITFTPEGGVQYSGDWTKNGEPHDFMFMGGYDPEGNPIPKSMMIASNGPGEFIWGVGGRGWGALKDIKHFPKLFKKKFWKNNIISPFKNKVGQFASIVKAYNPITLYNNWPKGSTTGMGKLMDFGNLANIKRKLGSVRLKDLDPRNIFWKDWSAALMPKGPFGTYYNVGPAAGTFNANIRAANIAQNNKLNPNFAHMTGNWVNQTKGGQIPTGQFDPAAFYTFKYSQGIDPTRLTLFKGYRGGAERNLANWNKKLNKTLSQSPGEGLLFGPQFGKYSTKGFNIQGGSPFLLNNRGYMTHQQMRWDPNLKMYRTAPELGGGVLGGKGIYGNQAGLNQSNYFNNLFGNKGMGQLWTPYQNPNLFNVNIQQANLRNALNYRINPYLKTTSSWNPTFKPIISDRMIWWGHRGSTISTEYDRYQSGVTNRYNWLFGPSGGRNPNIEYHDQYSPLMNFFIPYRTEPGGNPLWMFESPEALKERHAREMQKFKEQSLFRYNLQRKKEGEEEVEENPFQMEGEIKPYKKD